jgi:hypothetical protein
MSRETISPGAGAPRVGRSIMTSEDEGRSSAARMVAREDERTVSRAENPAARSGGW